MAAINEHTRKQIMTGPPSDAYRDGWDRIFGQKKGRTLDETAELVEESEPEQKGRTLDADGNAR